MSVSTNIEWVDRTWSPWIGCTKISPACDGCYAAHLMDTRLGRVEWGPRGERRRTSVGYWRQLATWNREALALARRITVFPSLCDPFDNQADASVRREWFAEIRRHPNLLWLLLTKRPQNAVKMSEAAGGLPMNVALGTTVEDQDRAINLFHLAVAARETAPRFTFASFEPLLGPVDPTRIVLHEGAAEFYGQPGITKARILFDALRGAPSMGLPPLGWAITGGESDQGKHKARPSNPQWYRDIRDPCAAAGIPYLHKQNGEWAATGDWYADHPTSLPVRAWTGAEWTDDGSRADLEWVARVGKKAAGRLLDGRTHDAMPEAAE